MLHFYTALTDWLANHVNGWTLFGLLGQGLFTARFLVQWIASEKAKASVVPELFWYFSIGGGLIVFVYGYEREDLVIMLGQGTGLLIYLRNLYFIRRNKKNQVAIG